MMTGPQILSLLTPFRHANSPNPHEWIWSVQIQFIHKGVHPPWVCRIICGNKWKTRQTLMLALDNHLTGNALLAGVMAEFAKTMDKTHNLRSVGSPVGFHNVLQISEEGVGWDLLRIDRYMKSHLKQAWVSHTPGNLAYCDSCVLLQMPLVHVVSFSAWSQTAHAASVPLTTKVRATSFSGTKPSGTKPIMLL